MFSYCSFFLTNKHIPWGLLRIASSCIILHHLASSCIILHHHYPGLRTHQPAAAKCHLSHFAAENEYDSKYMIKKNIAVWVWVSVRYGNSGFSYYLSRIELGTRKRSPGCKVAHIISWNALRLQCHYFEILIIVSWMDPWIVPQVQVRLCWREDGYHTIPWHGLKMQEDRLQLTAPVCIWIIRAN